MTVSKVGGVVGPIRLFLLISFYKMWGNAFLAQGYLLLVHIRTSVTTYLLPCGRSTWRIILIITYSCSWMVSRFVIFFNSLKAFRCYGLSCRGPVVFVVVYGLSGTCSRVCASIRRSIQTCSNKFAWFEFSLFFYENFGVTGGLQDVEGLNCGMETPNKPESGAGSSYEEVHRWHWDDSEVMLERYEAPRATEHLAVDNLIDITPAHTDGGKSLSCTKNDPKDAKYLGRTYYRYSLGGLGRWWDLSTVDALAWHPGIIY